MCEDLAKTLNAKMRVVFEPTKVTNEMHVAEPAERYRPKPAKTKVPKGGV